MIRAFNLHTHVDTLELQQKLISKTDFSESPHTKLRHLGLYFNHVGLSR